MDTALSNFFATLPTNVSAYNIMGYFIGIVFIITIMEIIEQ